MMANAALIVGVVRDVMAWPSYELEELDLRPIPVVAGIVPGKHTTRKGWLTKDFQYPQSPYTCDIDARIWDARDGSRLSLRDMARKVAWYFRHGIRRYSDPFTVRPVSYTHLRAHETPEHLVCRLLLEKKKNT